MARHLTVREALRQAARCLAPHSGDEAHLEAELLLCHVLGLDRARLYQHLPAPLPAGAARRYDELLRRRLAGEPLAYMLGRREFFGLELEVGPAVLVPRPETELLAELALSWLASRPAARWAMDVGTGCGAIALALAAYAPAGLGIVASDISGEALALARRNALRLGLAGRLHLIQADLLGPVRGPLDLLVANLPYVPTAELAAAPPEVRREPRIALDGGPDGLRVVARLLEQAPARMASGGLLLLEIAPDQAEAASALARRAFPGARPSLHRDLSGAVRALSLET